jgi:hypothetical protein
MNLHHVREDTSLGDAACGEPVGRHHPVMKQCCVPEAPLCLLRPGAHMCVCSLLCSHVPSSACCCSWATVMLPLGKDSDAGLILPQARAVALCFVRHRHAFDT